MMCSLRPLLLLLVLSAAACQVDREGRGGYLTVGVGSDPLTWNRLLATDRVSHTVCGRIQAALVRVNRKTQEVEPELAESWSFSEDGKLLTFHLRSAVRFSDGVPFSAEDVAFTFRALHDPDVGSPLTETAKVEGVPLVPEVMDATTVQFRLPRRTAVVERIFDSIPILPRHRLESALERGDFASAYGIGAPVEDIVGLGPFVIGNYLPGQRVVLNRNPHYWKKGPSGEELPLLDGIIFEILPDSNARVLKFMAGELDIQDELLPEDFIRLREKAPPNVELSDLGPGLTPERLWFNLNPASPTVSSAKRAWFSDERFRRAMSFAIDRRSIVDAVYHGLASPILGPVSPANEKWRNASLSAPRLDREEAHRLLESAGFSWNEQGRLVGPKGEGVRFVLVTNADNRRRTQMAALVQEDLAQIGIEMALAPLDRGTLLGRITRGYDYDACLLGMTLTDPDPSAAIPLWSSRASLHLWYPAETRPATDWEARIDELMDRQMLELDYPERKRLYDEVQAILTDKMPMINLVVPHALLAVNRRVRNLAPTPFWTPPLWNCEIVYLSTPDASPHR